MGRNNCEKLCEYFDIDFDETWTNLKDLKLHILTSFTVDTIFSDLSGFVKYLYVKREQFEPCYIMYSHVNSQSAHLMWLEQWNALNVLFCSGKKINIGPQTLTHKMNININTQNIAHIDLREPALKYTLEVARHGSIDIATAKSQKTYRNIWDGAQEKTIKTTKRRSAANEARKFFDIKSNDSQDNNHNNNNNNDIE
jgi:hypothetical protein